MMFTLIEFKELKIKCGFIWLCNEDTFNTAISFSKANSNCLIRSSSASLFKEIISDVLEVFLFQAFDLWSFLKFHFL